MQPKIPNQDKIEELIDKAIEKRIAELMKDYHLPTKEYKHYIMDKDAK